MKLFFIKISKYRQASTWISAYLEREEKKRALQPIVEL